MFKRMLAVLLVLMMVVSLAGCGSKETGSEEVATTQAAESTETGTKEAVQEIASLYPDEKVLIAVEIYDSTDSEFLALKEYFNYLAETFNVEFKFSEAITDAEMEMKFIEDSAVAGAKALMSYYNVTGVEQVSKAIEYGMYVYGLSEDKEVYEAFKDNPMYLGSVDNGNLNYEGGKAMGEWVVKNGFDKVVYSNGGADFGVPIFVNRQKGFYDGIGDANVEVIVVSGFPSEQFFADQAAALGTEGLDAVVASFNGVDFWAQPIATAGLTEVKLATFGSVNQAYVDAFKNGSVDLVVSGNIQSFAFVVPLVINALDGNGDVLRKDGAASNPIGSGWIIDSLETCEYLNNIQNNEKVYSADVMKKLIYNLNNEANATTFQEVLDLGKMDNLMK